MSMNIVGRTVTAAAFRSSGSRLCRLHNNVEVLAAIAGPQERPGVASSSRLLFDGVRSFFGSTTTTTALGSISPPTDYRSPSPPLNPPSYPRFFSAISREGGEHKSKDDKGDGAVVLFRRNPELTLLRTGVGFSSFHTCYWLWYVTEFIPLVNSSPAEQLHIDPTLGAVGLLFSIAIQTLFFVYPTRLVSKLEYVEKTRKLRLYAHRTPWVRPSSKPVEVPVGDIAMDTASEETKKILDQHHGEIQDFVGHVGIGPPPGAKKKLWSLFPYMSYLLDIRQPSNVPEPDLLLKLMLHPEDVESSTQPSGIAQILRSSRTVGGRKTGSMKRGRASRQRSESRLRKILRKGR